MAWKESCWWCSLVVLPGGGRARSPWRRLATSNHEMLRSWACTQGQTDQGASTVLQCASWSGLEGKLLLVQPCRATRWGQGEEAIPTRRHVQPRNVKELGLYSRSTRSRRVDCATMCVLEWPGGKVVVGAASSCYQVGAGRGVLGDVSPRPTTKC